MFISLEKLLQLSDNTYVYCGHEYTQTNLRFLNTVFHDCEPLNIEKKIISEQLLSTGFSMPFNLGKEKKINPFLGTESSIYKELKHKKKFSKLEMFSYLRGLRNNFK